MAASDDFSTALALVAAQIDAMHALIPDLHAQFYGTAGEPLVQVRRRTHARGNGVGRHVQQLRDTLSALQAMSGRW
jgi:hypothetical protein